MRPREYLERLKHADSIDWSFAALFFSFGMLAALIVNLVWG